MCIGTEVDVDAGSLSRAPILPTRFLGISWGALLYVFMGLKVLFFSMLLGSSRHCHLLQLVNRLDPFDKLSQQVEAIGFMCNNWESL